MSELPGGMHRDAVRPLAVVVLAATLWRLPSLFDPPWVNDEGTYFAVAQAMAHGYRLYSDVWENKPPALYLLYGEVYHLLGPSLFTIRLLVMLVAALAVVITYLLSKWYANHSAALASSLLVGLLLGVPFLEGTTGNAEIFCGALSGLGIYLAVVRRNTGLAGGLLCVAILFKVVAGFDAVALGLWLLWYRPHDFRAYLAGLVSCVAVVVVITSRFDILAGMVNDAVFYPLGYVGQANGGGIPWILCLKAATLLASTVLLLRLSFPYLWLGYAVTGALISGRFFGHYALQFLVPLGVCVAMAIKEYPSRAQLAIRLLPACFVAGALVSALVGWTMVRSGNDTILARRLEWYPSFLLYAVGRESSQTFQNHIDDHVTRNVAIAQFLRSRPPGKLLIWGNAPWIYVLSRRLPATPYTSSLRIPEIPGETVALRQVIHARGAYEIAVIRPPLPALGPAAHDLRYHYRPILQVTNATVYELR